MRRGEECLEMEAGRALGCTPDLWTWSPTLGEVAAEYSNQPYKLLGSLHGRARTQRRDLDQIMKRRTAS